MGVLGQKKFHGADGKFKYGAFVNKEEEDVAVLEDKSGRITIKNGPNFNIDHFVSGSILALKGKAITGGYFEVQDYCFAGVPFRQSPLNSKQLSRTNELYDPTALKSKRQFVALVSGLQFGKQASTLQTELLVRFLRGEFPDTKS